VTLRLVLTVLQPASEWPLGRTFQGTHIRLADVVLAVAGGLMLTPRAHTTIINSSLSHCKAWAGGGGIASVMAFNESRDKTFLDDLNTTLLLDNVTYPLLALAASTSF
jgi:hypothetical protein